MSDFLVSLAKGDSLKRKTFIESQEIPVLKSSSLIVFFLFL